MSPLPIVTPWTSDLASSFPTWVAIDKHTPEGRNAIQRAGAKLKIPPKQLSWISFYLESAKVNYLVDSPWWDAEMKWRFLQLGISESYASEVWIEASEVIQKELYPQTLRINKLIKNSN